MGLTPGVRLGPYEIQSALGAGGMGDVYRARDTKLNRDVALKILPDAFAADGERLARFKREAQVLASLNHPHIAAIYGFEDSGDTHALVLELAEGPTLADRIVKGPIPLDEALPIAKQIAEALESAHEQGIIHRDLKPANIKVRDDGTVKVLDFGLAKALEPASALSPSLTNSPTITTPAQMTGIGTILGTAAYMSPEQAKGRPVDKRSDMWAFGCVLYEMLTGHRAFEGEDVSDTLANVLKGEPDWKALPRNTPLSLTRLLRRCLSKDRRQRLGDISTARLELEDASRRDVAGSQDVSLRSLAWQIATIALAIILVGVAVVWRLSSRPAAPATTAFLINAPADTTFTTGNRDIASAVISPNGEQIAFTARSAAGITSLYVRPLAALTAHLLPGTEGATAPFWSPDNRFIAYSIVGSPARLMKVRATGGPSELICTFTGTPLGAWNSDGVIVVGGDSLQRVAATGGMPSPLWPPQKEFIYQQSGPIFLPDGRHLVFYQWLRTSTEGGELFIATINGGRAERIATADSPAAFDPQSGRLLFVRQGTLYAQPFDVSSLRLVGEPRTVTTRIASASANRWARTFSVSETGAMVYGVGNEETPLLQLSWFDQHGKPIGNVGAPAEYRGLELSPDGTHIAAHIHNAQGGDIWTIDAANGRAARLTFEPARDNAAPVWSPDGRDIAFASTRGDGNASQFAIYRKPSNGVGNEKELTPATEQPLFPTSWAATPDALVYQFVDSRTRHDLWLLPLAEAHHATPLVQSRYEDGSGQVSPDGRWLAYHSNETGQFEVYVRPFPSGEGRWQVSTSGAVFPRWQRDGRALFFIAGQAGRIRGNVAKVEVRTGTGAFESSTPQLLFDADVGLAVATHPSTGGFYQPWAVSPDGQRFLITTPVSTHNDLPAVAVVLNWPETLKP